MILVNLIKTCNACPEQYEGQLEDGRMVYIRYRHGYGSIRISDAPTSDIYHAVTGKELYGWTGAGDGWIEGNELEEALAAAGIQRSQQSRSINVKRFK